jgi:hypothetical protein
MDAAVLADDEAERIDGGNNENPFGYTKFLTLDYHTRVQTEANEGVGCDKKDPFRDL